MKSKKRSPIILFYLIAFIVIFIIYYALVSKLGKPEVVEIEYSKFIGLIKNNEVSKVKIEPTKITIEPKEQKGIKKVLYEQVYPLLVMKILWIFLSNQES